MLPGLGVKAGGAARWLAIPGGGVFEPSELLKIALSLLLATYFSSRAAIFGKYEWPLRGLLFIIPLFLVLRQPDFGSFFICTTVFVGVLFANSNRSIKLIKQNNDTSHNHSQVETCDFVDINRRHNEPFSSSWRSRGSD